MNNNIYSVSDKAIYDALCQGTVTRAHIVDLFLSRGVVVNPNTDKKKLAMMFSQRFHDFQDYLFLADVFSVKAKKERSCIRFLKHQDLSQELLLEVLNNLSSKIVDIDDARSTLLRSGTAYHVNIDYKQINFNKSEFRQIDERTGLIEVNKTNDGYAFRMPHNQTFVKIFERIIGELNRDDKISGVIDVDEISLAGIKDPSSRSKFFEILIEKLPDMKMVNVSGVYVFNPTPKPEEVLDDEESDLDDDELIDTGVAGVNNGHIYKATLTGSEVLDSRELIELNKRGFYIFKITWTCKFSVMDSDLYEFEAQFSDPENFTSFSYKLKGQYGYKEEGLYNSFRSKLDPDYTESYFLDKVEQAAISAIDEIENETQGKLETTQGELVSCD